MPAPFHFDCIFYYVSDLDRSVEFYRDVLGFKLTSRDMVARFDVEGTLFELVPSADLKHFRGNGNARLALRVDDMESATQTLRAKGVSTVPVEDKGSGLLSFFRDPDGNEICLWQYLEPRLDPLRHLDEGRPTADHSQS